MKSAILSLHFKKETILKVIFWSYLFFIAILPFLGGGFSPIADILIFILPAPLFFLFLTSGKPIFFPKFFIFFAFLIVSQFLSTLNSLSLALSVPSLIRLVNFILLLLIFANLDPSDPDSISKIKSEEKSTQPLKVKLHDSSLKLKTVILLILLDSLLLSFLSIGVLIFKKFPPTGLNLYYGSYGHNHLIDYLAFALPISFVFFLSSKKKLIGTISLFLFLFYFINLLLTFSRTGLVIWVLIGFLILFYLRPKRNRALIIFASLFFCSAFLSITLIISKNPQIFPSNFLGNWLKRQIAKPLFLESRIEYWRQAWVGFKQKPIFGNGIGTFEIISRKNYRFPSYWSRFAHSFFFENMAESGMFGLFAALFFYGYVFKFSYSQIKKSRNNPLVAGSFFAILFSFLHSCVDFDWSFPAIFLTFLTLFLAISSEKKSFLKTKTTFFKPLVTFCCLFTFFFGLTQAASYFSFKMANNYRTKAEIKKAQKLYFWTLKIYPWDYQYWQSWIEYSLGKNLPINPENVKWINLFYKNNYNIQNLLARWYLSQNQPEKALEQLKRLIILDPIESIENLDEFEKISKDIGKPEEIGKTYILYSEIFEERGLFSEKTPSSSKQKAANILFKLALWNFKKENYNEAFDYFLKSYRMEPWVLCRHEALPILEKKADLIKKYANIVRQINLEFCCDWRPYYTKVLYLAGLGYLDSDISKTADLWLKAANSCTEWTHFSIESGNLFLYLKNFDQAALVFRNCLKTYPDDYFCQEGLAHALDQEKGNYPGSLEKEIREQIPDVF